MWTVRNAISRIEERITGEGKRGSNGKVGRASILYFLDQFNQKLMERWSRVVLHQISGSLKCEVGSSGHMLQGFLILMILLFRCEGVNMLALCTIDATIQNNDKQRHMFFRKVHPTIRKYSNISVQSKHLKNIRIGIQRVKVTSA